MIIRDKISRFLMKRVIKSKIENLDNPGYITFGIGLGDTGKELREVFLPESIYVGIENRFEEEFGDEGAERLYRAGKRYGWRYTEMADFPNREKASKKDLEKWFDFFTTYASTEYASKLKQELDLEKDVYELHGQGYSVCRRNGKGYIIGLGAVGGAVGRVFGNPKTESYQTSCVGRGDEECHLICTEPENIPDEPLITYPNVDKHVEVLERQYKKLNTIKEVEHASKSLKDLINQGLFKRENGLLFHKSERHVPLEISIFDLIEDESHHIEGAPLILFDVSYKTGKKLGEGEDLSFLTDYLSSLGWGDVKVIDGGRKIEVKHFPWTRYTKNSDFNIFRGLVSGIVSAIRDEDTRFNEYSTETQPESFNLTLKSEK